MPGGGDAGSGETGGRDPRGGKPGRVGRALGAWAAAMERHALGAVLVAGGVAAAAGAYAATHLGVDTDTAEMTSASLPWRQTLDRFRRAFPDLGDQVLVVIEGLTPGQAEDAQRALAERLRARGEGIRDVHLPNAGPFFDRHALLYLPAERLETVADRLGRYGLFLERVERDPTLEGFVAALRETMEETAPEESVAEEPAAQGPRPGSDPDLAPILGLFSAALAADLERLPFRVSWQDLLTGGRSTAADQRRFIVIAPEPDTSRALPARPALEATRAAIAELGLREVEGLRVRVTGAAAMEVEELRSALEGGVRAGLLSLVLVAGILWVALRSWRLMAAAVATLATGLLGTAAFAAVWVGDLNLISIAFAVLYIGLGIDYAIHLCLRYRELLSEGGERPLRGALEDVGGSLFLSAVTTAVAFYVFVPTDFTGASELGLISGTGMLISFAVTVTLLPAMLALLSGRGAGPAAGREGASVPRSPAEPVRRVLAATGEALLDRRAAVLLLTALLALGSALLLPRLRFDHDPLNLRDPDTEAVRAYRALLRDTAAAPLTLSVLAGSLDSAAAVARRAEELDQVGRALSLRSFVPGDQARKLRLLARIEGILGEGPAGERPARPEPARPDPAGAAPAPDGPDGSRDQADPAPVRAREALSALGDLRRELGPFRFRTDSLGAARAAQLRFLLGRWERSVATWPPATRALRVEELERKLVSDLPGRLRAFRRALAAGPVALEDLPASLVDRWVSPSGVHRVEIRPAGTLETTADLRRFVDGVREVLPDATGPPAAQLEAGRVVVGAFRQASLWALVATALLLLLLLRSPRDVSLVLAPMGVAALLAGAAAVLSGTPLNFANIITIPLLLGVGVDNGIHVVHRLRAAPPPDGNLLRTSTAHAVLFSSATTIAGFGNLAFAGHRGMAGMGRLLTFGMLAVVVATLIVLPALLGRRTAGAPRV